MERPSSTRVDCFAENQHSDPTADGAVSPVPQGCVMPAGSIYGPCAIAMAPGVLAEASAGEAMGTAACLLMLGAKSITIMSIGMPVTHLSYTTVLLTSVPATLQIPGGSRLMLVAWLGYMLIQYTP